MRVCTSSPFAARFVLMASIGAGAIPTIPEWCGETMRSLIERCLSRNPAKRPTVCATSKLSTATILLLTMAQFMEIISELRVLAARHEEFFYTYDVPRILDMV